MDWASEINWPLENVFNIFFIQFYNLYERLDIEISIYAWVQMLMYDYLSYEQPFLVFILSGVFYLVAAYFTGFLENRFAKLQK